SAGQTFKRKRGRPRGSRTKSKGISLNDRPTFKPKYYDCGCDDCDSYVKQKNARNMRKVILLSKRASTQSQGKNHI
ncbi:unnamed protein product, partial [Brassica oleracea]